MDASLKMSGTDQLNSYIGGFSALADASVRNSATVPTATTSLSIDKVGEVRLIHASEPDYFGSLDELKEASNSLLPPFKTVGQVVEFSQQEVPLYRSKFVSSTKSVVLTKEYFSMQQ